MDPMAMDPTAMDPMAMHPMGMHPIALAMAMANGHCPGHGHRPHADDAAGHAEADEIGDGRHGHGFQNGSREIVLKFPGLPCHRAFLDYAQEVLRRCSA